MFKPDPTRLPWPMALTTMRLLLVPIFLILLIRSAHPAIGNIREADIKGSLPLMSPLMSARGAALGVFLLMAITDKLDGYLARRLNQVTKLGTLLDPTADKLLVAGGFLILAMPRFAPAGFAIPWPILWGVFQKDLCVLLGASVVKWKVGKVQINASTPGKINTAVEVTLVIATLLAPEWILISPAFCAIFLWSLWHLTVLATAAAAMNYSIEGARQLRAANRPV